MAATDTPTNSINLRPPVAKKVKHQMEMFGDVRVDNYYWLRDDSRSNPEILSYLQQENAYTDFFRSGTKHLEDQIYAELRGRIKEDDISAPTCKGTYYYYERTLEGKEYVQHCRRLVENGGAVPSVHDIMPIGPEAPPEHVILDENVKAKEHAYYSIGDEALLYITMDEILRPDKVWFHKLGTYHSTDSCIYHEKDDMFSLVLEASDSKKYLFVGSESKTTRFMFYFDISNPENGLMVLTPRSEGIDTSVSHRGNHFFIKRRSDEAFNSELLACPLDDVNSKTILLPHRESIKIQDVRLFSDHLVVYEREKGLPRVTFYSLPAVGEPLETLQGGRAVDFIDPVYSVDPAESQFSSSILRYYYSSLRTPPSTYDYDMNTGVSVLKKIETICMDPSFKASRLSLLDRGFIYALAHIRGGGEMGRKWYENGKYLQKKNTFTDFIDCAEYLIEKKYCTKETLCIYGGSAGGLLIGAVLNMRPDLFKAAVAAVPFVDVVTTMLDPTIPLTTSEWEEWGDPRKEEFYFYMKSYSPVDNVNAQNYPAILVTAGFNDPRVLYCEPAKFVAKLRDMKTDENVLLFKCEMGAGHCSKSGRFEKLQEDAFTYTFLLKILNMVPALG